MLGKLPEFRELRRVALSKFGSEYVYITEEDA